MIANPKNVNVSVTMAADKKSISITVSEEPVVLSGFDGVGWTITSDGWTFTKTAGVSTGIKVKNGGNRFNDNGGQGMAFKNHSWERPPAQADGNYYQYTISVTNETIAPTTPTTLIWDPTIHNN